VQIFKNYGFDGIAGKLVYHLPAAFMFCCRAAAIPPFGKLALGCDSIWVRVDPRIEVFILFLKSIHRSEV